MAPILLEFPGDVASVTAANTLIRSRISSGVGIGGADGARGPGVIGVGDDVSGGEDWCTLPPLMSSVIPVLDVDNPLEVLGVGERLGITGGSCVPARIGAGIGAKLLVFNKTVS